MTAIATEASSTATTSRVDRPSQGRGWVVAGVVAGVAGIVSIVASTMSDAVYDEKLAGDAVGITDKLADQTAQILVMHTSAMVSALLLLVYLPSVLQLSGIYRTVTTLSPGRFLQNWLGISAALFAVSAVAYALRLRKASKRATSRRPRDA